MMRIEGSGDLMRNVLAHLADARSLARASAVSRAWREAALDPLSDDTLWRPLCAPYPLLAVLKTRGGARSWRSLLTLR